MIGTFVLCYSFMLYGCTIACSGLYVAAVVVVVVVVVRGGCPGCLVHGGY